MKRLIFIIASILLGQTVCAQDIIQKKDATEIQAKVLKITDTEIEYQRWDNPDGPIYTIPAEDVFTITYQNGSKEVISHFDSSRRSAADKQQFGKLPRYQGEVAFAYGSAVSEGMQESISPHRIRNGTRRADKSVSIRRCRLGNQLFLQRHLFLQRLEHIRIGQ